VSKQPLYPHVPKGKVSQQKYTSLSLSQDTWAFISAALLEYAAVNLEKGLEANAKRANELYETIRYQIAT